MEGASTQQKQLKSCCDIMRESGLADRRLHSESPVGRPHDHCLHRMRSSCPNLREPKRVHRILYTSQKLLKQGCPCSPAADMEAEDLAVKFST